MSQSKVVAMPIHLETRLLKKLQRNPEKFDALSVFAVWAQRNGLLMTQVDAVDKFAQFLRSSISESLASDTMLQGVCES
jgi:hypothetical protein